MNKQNAILEYQQAKALKTPSTSPNSPVSGIVKPKMKLSKRSKKRKREGQQGYARHRRPSFSHEAIDEFFTYALDCCPDCDHILLLNRNKALRIIQQIEIKKRRHA